MIKSMTGFGRACSECEEKNFTVEIKSVNHRYLDLNIRMPRNLISLEPKIRSIIKDKINRGKIDLFIMQEGYGKTSGKATLNKVLANSYLKCLNEIKDDYNVKDDISVSLIAKFPDVIVVESPEENLEEIWRILSETIKKALDNFIFMRKTEGEKLKFDMLSKCDKIKGMVNEIEKHSYNTVKDYKEKLEERLKELLSDTKVDEDRLAMEVTIFADRACIDEEIVRLNSHIIQAKKTLELDEPVGRKLDFIIQEMNRETNTIASKANNLDITNIVLNIKSEIEKLREQIQNIE